MNGVCLVVYQAKKIKNLVLLLNSSHADNLIATYKTKTSNDPGLKKRKEVDAFDKNLEEFSCRRKTVATSFFYNIIDAAANNAYILLRKAGEYNYQNSVFEKTDF